MAQRRSLAQCQAQGLTEHLKVTVIMRDGRKRNSVRFSIIDDEWPEVKAMLLEKMSRVL